jgi:hypothetical protein
MLLRERTRSADMERTRSIDVARASSHPRRWNGDNDRDRHRWHNDHGNHHHHCHKGHCSRNDVAFFFGSYASDYYDDYYYGEDEAVAYCKSRFRTYNPATGTYKGKGGRRYACP